MSGRALRPALSDESTVSKVLYDAAVRQWSADCARPSEVWVQAPQLDGTRLNAATWVRCRKCEPCRRARARLWAARSIDEWKAAGAAFLVTLTYAPGRFYPSPELFEQHLEQAGRDLTLWFKRLRKAGAKFRYFAAAEAHKSGVPHWHVFLLPDARLARILANERSHRWVAKKWGHGFVDVRPVTDPRGCWYVAKYLGKDARTRVRASQNFGAPTPNRATAGPTTSPA